MGLAASQAKFLLLTRRKSDIEGQLSSLALQKLSLARQSANISDDYTQALNTTKLVWDPDGDKHTSDFTYASLMNSNNETPYILTNSSNKVVLSATDPILTNFPGLSTTTNHGEGSPNSIDSITNENTFASTMASTATTGTQATQTTSTITVSTTTSYTTYTDSSVYNYLRTTTTSGRNGFECDGVKNYTDFVTTTTSSNGTNPAQVCNSMADATAVQSGVEDICGDVEAALRSNGVLITTSLTSTQITTALRAATDMTKRQFSTDNAIRISVNYDESRGGCWYINSNRNQIYRDITQAYNAANDIAVTTATNSNRLVIAPVPVGRNIGDPKHYFNAAQVIQTFLAYFDAACAEGDGNPGTVSNTYLSEINSTTNRPVTAGVSVVTTTTTTVVSTSTSGNTTPMAYYRKIYNALKTYGWKVYSNTSDEFLQNQVLNGNFRVLKNSNNTWVNVSTNSSDSGFDTEDDKEAIRTAEATYNAEKDKIKYKENFLDLQIKNLDTEREAINTDVESVKSILKKHLEDDFKLFQA